jgi:hypothetical protein
VEGLSNKYTVGWEITLFLVFETIFLAVLVVLNQGKDFLINT